jgi:hypothetical protein
MQVEWKQAPLRIAWLFLSSHTDQGN